MNIKSLLLLPFLFIFATTYGQKGYTPSAENLKYRQTFQDNKFGVFIHWGIYSMMADGEWVMNIKKINYDEYSKLAGGFYPSKFDAKQWVANVKASGAKYICITSRHHDGFSMFDTKQSDFNIMKASPFKRDVLKELAAECRTQGIKLHFYYSLLDWGRADYNPNGPFITKTEETKQAKWETYHAFMKNQLRELLTNYGEIGAIWFDGKWEKPKDFDWKFDEIYSLIHSLQPACLILNNHHLAPLEGEDAQTFERDLPGQNTAGHSGDKAVSKSLPLETCETMNGSWGYNITDLKYKSEKELVQYLVKAAGNNANLLLNVGPRPDGTFQDIAVERLQKMGNWLSKYGESIYGTRNGQISPQSWGITTQKDNRLFVHILNLQDKELFLPIVDKKVRSAKFFIDKKPVKFTKRKDGIVLSLDKTLDPIDEVIELSF